MPENEGDTPFTDDFVKEFRNLYDRMIEERFRPALAILNRSLKTLVDTKCPPSQRLRLRVEDGRLKSQNRLLLKAQGKKYRGGINSPKDVFVVIHDIIGTRVTCNTLSDVGFVVSSIKAAATLGRAEQSILRGCEDWEDDYIKEPKPSGYRAVSLLVGVRVPVGDLLEPVTCEVQIRTLLQHAWGELTHEDTYKPGVQLPELVFRTSKRLADALAVLDEIAQDLRGELDKIETSANALSVQLAPQLPQAVDTPLPQPLLAQSDQPTPEPQLEPQAKRSWPRNIEELRQDTGAIWHRAVDLDQAAFEEILEQFAEAGIGSRDELHTALRETAETLSTLESEFRGVATLTDFGRLLAAVRIHSDPEKGATETRAILDAGKQRRLAATHFIETYPPGRRALGSVVYVAWNYALVQMPEGATGILHVTNMKNRPDEYVVVSDIVGSGDTVEVEIISSDPKRERIELRLVRRE